ncbi:replication protein RepA [Acidisoma sp. C75]
MELIQRGSDAAQSLATAIGQPELFGRVSAVQDEAPSPGFLHSALCAMSLPVRRPRDEYAPIMRQDGQYTLVINPKPRLDLVNGQQQFQSLGIPFGSLPRLILIHIMTEAVKTNSRHVHLGRNFSDWMRRMGFKTVSYGPRGSATLIKDQMDRLLSCEWMIRWDNTAQNGDHEFGIREIKLTNEYRGQDGPRSHFQREILMTEGFFHHLKDHAVPLNEVAIRQLRDSATALDLYTWLAYRLPRIGAKRPASLSWTQLAVHFGNDGKNIRKFRQTIRDAWERHVSAVYPEARAEFDTTVIRLYGSPAPLQQKLVQGATLRLVTGDDKGTPSDEAKANSPDLPQAFLQKLRENLGDAAFNAWFKRAVLEQRDGEWTLSVERRFHCDYIRSEFKQQLDWAARAVGLARVQVDVTKKLPSVNAP